LISCSRTPILHRQYDEALSVHSRDRNDVINYFARGKEGFRELLTDFLKGKGTLEQRDWAWEELFAFVKIAQTPVRNPLPTTYWTMAAVRHGDYVANRPGRQPGRSKAVTRVIPWCDGAPETRRLGTASRDIQ
jgi:hypothetical protein